MAAPSASHDHQIGPITVLGRASKDIPHANRRRRMACSDDYFDQHSRDAAQSAGELPVNAPFGGNHLLS